MNNEVSTAYQLFIDIGNTDIKWQDSKNNQAQRTAVADFSKQNPLYQHIIDAEVALISCMPHHPHYHRIAKLLKLLSTKWITTIPTNPNIQINYQEAKTYGIDRYLSLLAVANHAPLVLVDLGSAITIDMMKNKNEHTGGWILPGLPVVGKLLSLYGLTTNSNTSPSLELGNNTSSAIKNGHLNMLIHFLQHLEDKAQHYGLHQPNFILTGGNATYIAPHLSKNWQQKPNLVIEGLRCLYKLSAQ